MNQFESRRLIGRYKYTGHQISGNRVTIRLNWSPWPLVATILGPILGQILGLEPKILEFSGEGWKWNGGPRVLLHRIYEEKCRMSHISASTH